MVLENGMLAKVDRSLFDEMDRNFGSQMVRVPVSDALWPTWRRYCELLEVTMGEGIGGLIALELRSVVNDEGRTVSEMVEEISQKVAERSEALDERQQELEVKAENLARRERALRERQKAQSMATWPSLQKSSNPDVGRNEACPCGSGLKYKRCHGRPQ